MRMVLAKWLRGGRSILNKDELWSALLTMNGVTLLDVKIDRSSAPNWYRKFAGGIRDTRHFRFHDIPVLPNEMVGAYRAFARRLTDCGPVGSIISTETETALEVGKSAKSEKERRRVRSLSRSPSPSPTRAARGRTSASPSSRFCLPASASPAVTAAEEVIRQARAGSPSQSPSPSSSQSSSRPPISRIAPGDCGSLLPVPISAELERALQEVSSNIPAHGAASDDMGPPPPVRLAFRTPHGSVKRRFDAIAAPTEYESIAVRDQKRQRKKRKFPRKFSHPRKRFKTDKENVRPS